MNLNNYGICENCCHDAELDEVQENTCLVCIERKRRNFIIEIAQWYYECLGLNTHPSWIFKLKPIARAEFFEIYHTSEILFKIYINIKE